MLGHGYCRVFPSWRCKPEHAVGSLGNGQISVVTFIWSLFLYASVLGDDEAICKLFGVGIFRGSISLPVPATALQTETPRSAADRGSWRLLTEAAENAYQQETSTPSQVQSDGSHHSLGYWAAEAGSSGKNRVEVYSIVESPVNAAEHLTPSQLQSVTQLVRTTKREKIVDDEDRSRDKRFESFSAGLRDFARAKFRPFISRRAEKLHFRQTSLGHGQKSAPLQKASSSAKGEQRGDQFEIESVQLLEALPGRVASKVSVLVRGPKSKWSSANDSTTCLGRKCGSATKEVSGVAISFAESARPIQRKADSSHGLLQGFVSEVEGPISEVELETDLRWELHIWRYLPAWRALELAENEHILIPMHLLRYELQASTFDDRKILNTESRRHVTVGSRAKTGFSVDPLHEHVGGNSAGRIHEAAKVDVQEQHRWSDRLSEKVYNVFIYYPKGYRDTIGSSLIPSDQITETWFRTATTDFLLSISTQMILAVANFNSYGLVHTHIRPFSFVLDLDGVVLLSDLHRAVAVGETMDCLSDRISGINDLTASPEESACMYKYASNFEEHEDRKEYIAGPMQAEFPVDSWRLGVILYRLWCREPAHDRRSDHEFHFRHLSARAAEESVAANAYLEHNRLPMKYCRKDIPSSMQRLIRQMLVAEPAFRTTAAEAVKCSSLFYHLRRTEDQPSEHESEQRRQKLETHHKENA